MFPAQLIEEGILEELSLVAHGGLGARLLF
jgi:hypothetical protein